MRPTFRHTRIVCTLGPSTDDPRVLRRLIRAGADVVRINAAHGSGEEHARRIRRVRSLARGLGRPIGVLLDLPGPKLRLGALPGGSRELRRGEDVLLSDRARDEGVLPVDIPRFARHVARGQSVFLSDGSVRLKVRRIDGHRVRCRVEIGGTVRSGSGLNLPDSNVAIRIPTDDDERWIRFGRAEGVDWVGVSFVRTPADLAAVRARLRASDGGPLLIAKIEKRQALENLDAIIEAADGVMVARGDLGVETPLAEVPIAQKRIIAVANERGRPVVTATQMLESMVEDPSPTRAEVGDVANAVLDGTDAVMLSAETAIGRFPLRAVETLAQVIDATERRYPYGFGLERFRQRTAGALETALAAQACRMSFDLAAGALVAPAPRLRTAVEIARFRPEAPVFILPQSERLRSQLALVWGVVPLFPRRPGAVAAGMAGAAKWLEGSGMRRAPLVALGASEGRDGPLDFLRVVRGRKRRGEPTGGGAGEARSGARSATARRSRGRRR